MWISEKKTLLISLWEDIFHIPTIVTTFSINNVLTSVAND